MENFNTDTHTLGECHVKIKAENAVMLPKARNNKDCQQITRRKGRSM